MAEDELAPENGDLDTPSRFGRGRRRRQRSNSNSESKQTQRKRSGSRRASRRESADKEPEPRQSWIWLKQNWFIITFLVLIFLFGLFLRSYYYYTPATEDGYILSGNDPYYHKRVVDYVQDNHEHLIFDPLLSYPDGALNPRPPMYDWSVAITGLIVSPFAGGDVYVSTWIVMLFAPAFWGALTVFPTYLIGKEMFNKKAGLICAFLVATMPSHVERSPLGFSDHDAIVLFFVVLSFFFFMRALNTLKVRDKWIENWLKPREIPGGLKEWFVHNQVSVAFAVLAGFSLASIALIWKGFLYPVVIIIVYFFIQMVLNQLRNRDSLGVALITIITLAIIAIVPIPYYYGNRMDYVIEPAMEIFVAVLIVSAIMVPTRDSPWILVFSVLGVVLLCGFLLLMYVFPEIGSTYFSGQGYFAKNKVFSTIAEAQAPDYSRAMFSYGVVTTFLALFAMVLSIWRVAKDLKAHYLFLTIWAVTAVYMAISATRFIFNAGPIFAIMSGWMVFAIIEKLDFRKMVKHYRSLKGGGYFYAMKKSVKLRHVVGVLFLAFMIVLPNVWLGWDAGVPYGEKKAVDLAVYEALPENIHVENKFMGIDFWIDFKPHEYNSEEASNRTLYPKGVNIMYNKTDPNKLKYFGAFGHGFPSDYWLDGMRWLSEQDTELPIEDRPGFISWWDYGFWAIYLGQHPTAADNFQGRVQYAGSFISAQNETQGIALLITRLIEADRTNYFLEHGKSQLSSSVKDILDVHFDEEDADDIEEVVSYPTRFKKEVLDNPDRYGYYSDDLVADVTPIYAILQTWIPEMLTDEEMTLLYHDLQEETGWSLRYFAIDSRLFPFGAQNTGIFYAPLKLSDHRISEDNEPYDYLRTLVLVDGEWMTLDEFADARETDSSLSPTDYKLEYYEPFLGSMLMKCYIGYTLEDVGAVDPGAGNVQPNLPAIHETNYIPMQGWMMKHFRLVYRTAYWNPYNQTEYKFHPDDWEAMSENDANKLVDELENDGLDNDNNGHVDDRGEGGVVTSGLKSGVVFLKYYEGAIVSGNVTTTSGAPMPNTRVSVADDYGIPHDTVLTDENGSYSLIAPPGNTSVFVSFGGWGEDTSTPYRILSQIEQKNLNFTTINISDDAAMRREIDEDGDGVWDYNIVQNFLVDSNILTGKLFWDGDSDDAFTEGESNITEAEVIIYNMDLDQEYKTKTDELGGYEFDDVIPGEYNLSYIISGHRLDFKDTITFVTGEEKTQDIGIAPASISGVLYDADSGFLADLEVELFDKITDTTVTTSTNNDGNFSYDPLVSSNYTLIVDIYGYERYVTDVDIESGDAQDLNITLSPSTRVVGNTTNDETGSIVANVTVKFEFIQEEGGFSKLVTSNETGQYTIDVKLGKYTVSAKHDMGVDVPFRHIGELVAQGGELTYDVALEPGVVINGTVYFDFNGDGYFDDAETKSQIPISFMGQTGTLTAMSDSQGNYRISLPKGDYTVQAFIDGVSSNSTFSYLEELSVQGSDAIQYDIAFDRGRILVGYVYYDVDNDGEMQPTERIYQANVTFTRNDGLETVVKTDNSGRYSANLQVGSGYDIVAQYPHFEPNAVPFLNTTELPPAIDFEMIPITVNVSGETRYQDTPVGDIVISFEAVGGTGSEDNSTRSDNSTGEYYKELLPGDYFINVEYYTNETGKPVKYEFNSSLHLDVGQGAFTEILNLIKFVKINGTVQGTLGNVTINFEPLDDPEEKTTIIDSENSTFEVWLTPGEYNVWIDEEVDTTTHNVFLDILNFTESQTIQLTVELGTKVDVTTNHGPIPVRDVIVEFSGNGTLVKKSQALGSFEIFLPPNRTYNITVDTTLPSGNDYVLYTYQGVLQVLNATANAPLDLTKYIQVMGTVYIDYNENGDPDAGEIMDNVTVQFESSGHTVTSNTNATGGYEVFLLDDTDYYVNLTTDFALVYEDRTLTAELGLDDDERNWEITPANLTVSGQVTINGSAAGSTALLFFAESDSAVNSSAVSDASGNFSLELPLGEYTLYAKKVMGSDVYTYIGTFEPKPRESLALILELEEAYRVKGYAYYINSTEQNLSAEVSIEFEDMGTIQTTSQASGLFEVWLPASAYNVSSSLTTFEYNMSMDYDFSDTIKLTEDMDLIIPLAKDKKYSVELEWVDGVAANLSQNETTEYTMRITNTGNEKDTYYLSRNGVPFWNITMEESIFLDIGQSGEFPLPITSSLDAKVDHDKIEITASSQNNTEVKDTVEVKVNIAQLFMAAEISTGEFTSVAENNILIYSLNVQNPGNGDENFTLSLSDVPGDWNATLTETEISLGAYEVTNINVTINASYGTDARSAQLTITATSASGEISQFDLNATMANLDVVDEDLEVTGELVSEGPLDTSTIPGFEALALIGALIGLAFVMKRRRWL
jgi:dolichyl-diphosphooligosaccharide--protein glycosyltransferase